MIKVANLKQELCQNHVLRDISTQVAKGEVVVVIRAFRLREIHLPALPSTCWKPRTAAPSSLTGGDHRPQDRCQRHPYPDGYGVPAVQPLSHMTVRENIIVSPSMSEDVQNRRPAQGRRAAADGWALRQGGRLSLFLSGGQKQRIAIARALAMEPER